MQINKKSFKGQNIYVGIDVHLKKWSVCVLTDVGYTFSYSQHPDAQALYTTLCRRCPEGTYYSAYEAGFCGFSVHYALTSYGFRNIVVNPADIPTTGKDRVTKTDTNDSHRIAYCLRQGLLRPIHIKALEYMDDTGVVRLRGSLVRDLGGYHSRLKHYLYTQGVSYPERFLSVGTHWSGSFMRWLREDVRPLCGDRDTLTGLCDVVDKLRSSILSLTRHLRRLSRTEKYRQNYELLTSIPGFGLLTSMTLLTEMDNDVCRFPNERSFVSWLGLIPTQHDSGDHVVSGGQTHRGNKHAGPLLIEASWICIRRDPSMAAFYGDAQRRMLPQKAIVKTAHKLARRAYAVLKTRQPYVLA